MATSKGLLHVQSLALWGNRKPGGSRTILDVDLRNPKVYLQFHNFLPIRPWSSHFPRSGLSSFISKNGNETSHLATL